MSAGRRRCVPAGHNTSRRPTRYVARALTQLIYVVDSNDRDRVALARTELHRIAAEENVARAPILVWANKQDVKGAMNASEISDALNLAAFRDRTWQIFGCSALTGKGLTPGLDWLATTLAKKNTT